MLLENTYLTHVKGSDGGAEEQTTKRNPKDIEKTNSTVGDINPFYK